MGKTYFNHGITGNGKMLVSLTEKGEINRIFWPKPDHYQHIEHIHVGLKYDESETKFLNDNLWYVEQKYEPKSNIVTTTYENSDFGFKVYQKDFVLKDKDILVRNYKIEAISNKDFDMKAFIHTSFTSEPSNVRSGVMDFDNETAIIYNKETAVSIGADKKLTGFQFGNARQAVCLDTLYGKDDISMTSDMGLRWDIGKCSKNHPVDFTLYFCFAKDIKKSVKLFNDVKSDKPTRLIEDTKKYWKEFFDKFNVVRSGNEKIDDIYIKTLLIFALLSDIETGGVLAGVEIDENFTRCGGYGYCWGRDGAFIVNAIDICGMNELAEKFYTSFAKKSQLPNGSWQQRYLLDGSLAPAWGIQLDETASIIYGLYEHYKICKRISFLEEMWDSVKNAANFLAGAIDKETGLPIPSHDLWEERIGEHTYSSGAVVRALLIAEEISKELKLDIPLGEYWGEKALEIKSAIEKRLWSEEDKRFLRGINTRLNWWNCGTKEIELNPIGYKLQVAERDNIVDISLLGLCVPFNIFDAKDPRIKKTAKAIEERLDGFPSGGYSRYEHDSYIGGNPWIVSTLWLALYYIEIDEITKAKELFMWSVKHSTHLGFLPEQIDKFTGEPAWVMQLLWSHAMFVIVFNKLKKA